MSDGLKIVVAGSRTIADYHMVSAAINQVTAGGSRRGIEIVSGGARGVDQLAREYADDYDLDYTEFPADWDELGKSAGPVRNSQMADYGDWLVAVWDGNSRGTRDMIDKALNAGLDVFVFQVTDDE